MSPLLHTLISADADTVLFRGAKGDVSAGQIRFAAGQLLHELPGDAPRVYVYTKSASALCAAMLAAASTQRILVVLPQAGSDYLHSLSVPAACFVSDHGEFGHKVMLDESGSDVAFKAEDARAPHLIFFTSGSTGRAKEIDKPLAALELEAGFWQRWFDGRIAFVTGSVSHQHIYGMLFRIVFPIMAGLVSRDETALTWEALEADLSPQTLLVTGPAHLSRLPDFALDVARRPAMILSSGGMLQAADSRNAHEIFGVSPVEILGSTETGGVARRQNVDGNTMWTPLEGVSISANKDGVLEVTSEYVQGKTQTMGDRVEIEADHRFRLLGRADRIVKVEGKRVSLERVESVLVQHEFIREIVVLETQHADRPRLSALAVLTQEGSLKLGELGPYKMSKLLLSKYSSILEPAECPKRWRFIADIPVNAQSKRVQADLAKVFDGHRILELLSPQQKRVEDFTAELEFVADLSLPWFEGHFPNQPILPGLSQVHMAARLAEEIWGVAPASMKVSRMKFHRVVQPGEVVNLSLTYKPESARVGYKFKCGEATVSTGTIG